jgi:long-chain acyl-CoA synthetase
MSATLHDVWLKTVQRDPTAVALITAATDRHWTRQDLADLGAAWVQALPHPDDLRGRIVVFAQRNDAEWWRVFLGLITAGAIPAPLDPGESVEAQRQVAQAIGAAWVWHEGKLSRVAPDLPRRLSNAVSLIKVTSGSTDRPRAYKFTAGQMLADGRQVCRSMDIQPDDRNLAVIPFGHSYGLGNLVLPLLMQGTASVCAGSSLPQAIANDCRHYRPTIFPAVPALLRLLAASDLSADTLASLRVVISAGATLPPDTAQAFHQKFHRLVHGFYGSSETGGISYDRTGDASLAGRSVGPPLDGVTVSFRRGQRFTVTSAAVMGPGNFSPADRGELNDQGELVLLGRTGRTVKLAGRRVDLGEIETVARTVPGVRDAFAVLHARRADDLALAVATTLTTREVRTALQAKLAPWKVPARILTFETFPVTARGKTDARDLRHRLAQG